MREAIRLAWNYLDHRWQSANGDGHGVHSPFLFSFITDILRDDHQYPEYRLPEQFRRELLADHTAFDRLDLGAGSRKKSDQVTIRSMAQRSLQPEKWAQLLYRIIRQYRPGPVLELGTSFGVTTQYLALADPTQPVYTLEGDPFIAAHAADRFIKCGLHRVEVIVGDFDDRLGETLSKMDAVGLALIDGNHRKEPTLRYFEQLLPRVNNDSILIFDDVYWSASMQSAWAMIRSHPQVRCSIDLFRMGIVLFRSEFHEPLHIRLRY